MELRADPLARSSALVRRHARRVGPGTDAGERILAYEPVIGMPGKDVVWVPTPAPVIDFMLDMAKVTPNDVVIDLGSGDGRIVLAAAKRGARALGVELNADLVQLSKEEAERQGVSERAQFVVKDMFQTDLSPASVLTTYLLPHLNIRVRPQLLAHMKPGSRVVTYAFHMGEWQPDAVRHAPDQRHQLSVCVYREGL